MTDKNSQPNTTGSTVRIRVSFRPDDFGLSLLYRQLAAISGRERAHLLRQILVLNTPASIPPIPYDTFIKSSSPVIGVAISIGQRDITLDELHKRLLNLNEIEQRIHLKSVISEIYLRDKNKLLKESPMAEIKEVNYIPTSIPEAPCPIVEESKMPLVLPSTQNEEVQETKENSNTSQKSQFFKLKFGNATRMLG